VDFTPDGRLVTSGRDKVAKVWDQNGKLLLTTQPLPDIALRAVLAGDSLIAGDWTGAVKAFVVADGGKPVHELPVTAR
jgi:WD40 repeat protein